MLYNTLSQTALQRSKRPDCISAKSYTFDVRHLQYSTVPKHSGIVIRLIFKSNSNINFYYCIFERIILNQRWVNFIVRRSHLQVDFACVPDYSDLYKKKVDHFLSMSKISIFVPKT